MLYRLYQLRSAIDYALYVVMITTVAWIANSVLVTGVLLGLTLAGSLLDGVQGIARRVQIHRDKQTQEKQAQAAEVSSDA